MGFTFHFFALHKTKNKSEKQNKNNIGVVTVRHVTGYIMRGYIKTDITTDSTHYFSNIFYNQRSHTKADSLDEPQLRTLIQIDDFSRHEKFSFFCFENIVVFQFLLKTVIDDSF